MNDQTVRPVLSATKTARLLDKDRKTVTAMWRSGKLDGYLETGPNGRSSALKIYRDSIRSYQLRREAVSELRRAERGQP